jgi:hypothetical protein
MYVVGPRPAHLVGPPRPCPPVPAFCDSSLFWPRESVKYVAQGTYNTTYAPRGRALHAIMVQMVAHVWRQYGVPLPAFLLSVDSPLHITTAQDQQNVLSTHIKLKLDVMLIFHR